MYWKFAFHSTGITRIFTLAPIAELFAFYFFDLILIYPIGLFETICFSRDKMVVCIWKSERKPTFNLFYENELRYHFATSSSFF